MDLTNKQYAAKAREILKGADVVVENFRGRKIAELGLSAQTAAEIRPASSTPPSAVLAGRARGLSVADSTWTQTVVPALPCSRVRKMHRSCLRPLS